MLKLLVGLSASLEFFFVCFCASEPEMRQDSGAGNVGAQTPIREKGQRSISIWFAGNHCSVCLCVHLFLCMWFLYQWRTPIQRSCWGSCRRRGLVRFAWTSSCPLSSSPVVTWWCVVIVLPAYVTAPSAELWSEAVSELSCPKAVVWSHCCTGISWVALRIHLDSFSPVLIKIKIAGCLFCHSWQIIFYNKKKISCWICEFFF